MSVWISTADFEHYVKYRTTGDKSIIVRLPVPPVPIAQAAIINAGNRSSNPPGRDGGYPSQASESVPARK